MAGLTPINYDKLFKEQSISRGTNTPNINELLEKEERGEYDRYTKKGGKKVKIQCSRSAIQKDMGTNLVPINNRLKNEYSEILRIIIENDIRAAIPIIFAFRYGVVSSAIARRIARRINTNEKLGRNAQKQQIRRTLERLQNLEILNAANDGEYSDIRQMLNKTYTHESKARNKDDRMHWLTMTVPGKLIVSRFIDTLEDLIGPDIRKCILAFNRK